MKLKIIILLLGLVLVSGCGKFDSEEDICLETDCCEENYQYLSPEFNYACNNNQLNISLEESLCPTGFIDICLDWRDKTIYDYSCEEIKEAVLKDTGIVVGDCVTIWGARIGIGCEYYSRYELVDILKELGCEL